MPTICAALDIKLPTDRIYDGKNILPAIQGKLTEPLHKNIFWDGAENRWAVREGKWKLVFDKNAVLELYNLEKDQSETTNLATQHPDKVTDLKLKYETWRSEMKTPMGEKKLNRKKKQ